MNEDNMKKALEEHRAQDIHGHKLGPYIQDIVYGGIDGIVTTFAVVAVSAGAELTRVVVIVVGLANLFADAASMGIGSFLSMRSERDHYKRLLKEEEKEIDDDPEIERAEIREAFEKKGYSGAELECIVDVITSKKDVWLETMMREEHGLVEETTEKPLLHSTITFWSFIIFGGVPLLPYIFSQTLENSFNVAIFSTFIALVLLGLSRSKITKENPLRGPLEIVLLGGFAAVIAYAVGRFLREFAGTI